MRRIYILYKDAYSGLSPATWLIAFVSLINRSGAMVLVFLALYLKNELGYSVFEAGLFISLYGVGAICGMIGSGRLIDKIGAVPIQVASLLGMGIGFLALGKVDSTASIAAVLFATGVVGEAFRPASVACLAATCTAATRVKAFGINRLAINLGVAIAPVVGGYLASHDYGLLFVVDGVTCIAAAGVLLVLSRSIKLGVSESVEDQVPERSPWSDRTFVLGMVIVLAVAIVFLQMLSTLPVYFEDVYGFDEAQIGWLLGINPVLIVLFEMILVHRLASRPPLLVARWGVLLVGLGFGLMPLGSGFAFAAFTIAVWAFGEMLESPFVTTFVANRAGPKNRGRYMATYMAVFGCSFVLAPLVGTAVYDHWGPDVLWLGCAGIGVFSFLAFSSLARVVAQEESVALSGDA